MSMAILIKNLKEKIIDLFYVEKSFFNVLIR